MIGHSHRPNPIEVFNGWPEIPICWSGIIDIRPGAIRQLTGEIGVGTGGRDSRNIISFHTRAECVDIICLREGETNKKTDEKKETSFQRTPESLHDKKIDECVPSALSHCRVGAKSFGLLNGFEAYQKFDSWQISEIEFAKSRE